MQRRLQEDLTRGLPRGAPGGGSGGGGDGGGGGGGGGGEGSWRLGIRKDDFLFAGATYECCCPNWRHCMDFTSVWTVLVRCTIVIFSAAKLALASRLHSLKDIKCSSFYASASNISQYMSAAAKTV